MFDLLVYFLFYVVSNCNINRVNDVVLVSMQEIGTLTDFVILFLIYVCLIINYSYVVMKCTCLL